MPSSPLRFETREAINSAIARLVAAGVPLEDVDVALSRIGVVDLDLCVECLQDMASTMAERAIQDSVAEALSAA